MKRTCRIKYWLVAALMAGGSSCSAQYHPIVTAKVDSVTRAGIFRIVLPPSFVACCRPDLSDIRIIDGNGRQAPYVLRTDPGDKWNAGYTTIPDPHIVEHDSNDRHSYYLLQYNDSYRIERLSLVIRHPALYKRTAEILTAPGPDQQHVATITIDPADSVFSFQPVKAARLLIDVANEDNAPLAISRVATFQSGICLLAYLQPQQEYRLAADPVDGSVRPPEYDLRYFTDSMRAPVTIGLGTLQRTGNVQAPAPGKTAVSVNGNRPSAALWAIVCLILGLLLYVSVKLARAVDQRNEE